MSQREVLIMLAHAQWCAACRGRLVADPDAVFIGRALSAAEKEILTRLTEEDFTTPGTLARALEITVSEIQSYNEHPVARLRHF
ncbi:MAG: hypothetical protein CVU38_05865 [Chloroflexi bacterium HGW-Chloroflexi-1]|nr:MAG: hypothetical protein CVU38_05865 [Chloroflexi bacterium HGW-Chloroflexi-1]